MDRVLPQDYHFTEVYFRSEERRKILLKRKMSALLSSFDVISGSMFLCVCDAVVVLKRMIEDDGGEKEAVRILPESIGSWASSCEEAQEGLLLFNNVNLSLSWVLLHNIRILSTCRF